MKTCEQAIINEHVVDVIFDACSDALRSTHINKKQLRHCRAWVIETDHYYVLQSHNTVVACIMKHNATCYDQLRYVYRYTPTLAKHIAIFRRDYGGIRIQTWRPVFDPLAQI